VGQGEKGIPNFLEVPLPLSGRGITVRAIQSPKCVVVTSPLPRAGEGLGVRDQGDEEPGETFQLNSAAAVWTQHRRIQTFFSE